RSGRRPFLPAGSLSPTHYSSRRRAVDAGQATLVHIPGVGYDEGGAWPQPADDRAQCRLIVTQETHGDENVVVMTRRSPLFQSPTRPLVAKALHEGGRVDDVG